MRYISVTETHLQLVYTKKGDVMALLTKEVFGLAVRILYFQLNSDCLSGTTRAPTDTRSSCLTLRNSRGKSYSFPIIPMKMPRIESHLTTTGPPVSPYAQKMGSLSITERGGVQAVPPQQDRLRLWKRLPKESSRY